MPPIRWSWSRPANDRAAHERRHHPVRRLAADEDRRLHQKGLNLYFVTGRESQKLTNLQADPPVSMAIHSGTERGTVGVSMATRAKEVSEPTEVEPLNRLMFARWPLVSSYCPATSSIAIVHLKPELIYAILASAGRSQTECFSVNDVSRDQITSPGAASAPSSLGLPATSDR